MGKKDIIDPSIAPGSSGRLPGPGESDIENIVHHDPMIPREGENFDYNG